MAAEAKVRLAQQLAHIDSVQKCVLNQGADIVVHSWRGVLIHVHLVTEPLKTRHIKKTLHEATRTGIGTLYVVDARLLPPDGTRLVPDEWLLAVHTLTDEKIYTFHPGEADPLRISQVHLNLCSRPDEREVWYGPDVQIEQIPFFRLWVKMAQIKGDWLVANFGSGAFWRHPDYRSARYTATQQTAARAANAYERIAYGYGNGAAHVEREQMRRHDARLVEAYEQLGVEMGTGCDEVKAAFRRLVRECHPDVSALPKEQAEARFRLINAAYVYIREKCSCM
jgi:hypothetical protein